MKTGSFYIVTLRANAKAKNLAEFLEKSASCPGCLEIKILVDYRDRAGYFVTEL